MIKKEVQQTTPNLNIKLRWVKAYPNETKAKVWTGFIWSLAYLGAKLPKNSLENATEWLDETHFSIDLAKIGFSNNAQQALLPILDALRNSEEYTKMGAIDLGRFIMLTFNSSHHYYAITGVAQNLSDFTSQFPSKEQKNLFAMQTYESCVAKGNRIIRPIISNNLLEIRYVATEGNGDLLNDNFEATEFEVFDYMTNGQPRFAIYGHAGQLKIASDTSITLAGKPAKCMWCHESRPLKAFNAINQVADYMPPASFDSLILTQVSLIEQYHAIQDSDLDFSKRQDHAFTELLYISFMEPSANRLAQEWKITAEKVRELLKGLPTHKHHEFKYLGNLYHREMVSAFAPYQAVRVPSSAREWSAYEPSLIQ